ncbi:hypothetical protein UCDDS831_g00892 [Diplodia seriata]|uniref:Uncharacterized protein n=1 Tax=Diplodia seriata TaxID=420778 RepID=A0A0G2EWX8_9PEZI|nr:hypothetical protein UCDDS831_g00892 [Diplodia seriata]
MTPNPDFPAQVINAKYRHVRDNKAWIIGRLLRDQELSRRYAESTIPETDDAVRNQDFQMSFFRYDQAATAGEIKRDAVWYSGFAVMLLQLVVSIVPFATHRNWAPVTVTAGGTALALLHGAIPQWKSEKWSRVADIDSTVCITQGNGSSALGIHLVEEKGSTIKKPMIAEALREAEKRYPFIGVGSSLIPTFFPGGMRIPQDDVSFWTVAAKRRKLQGIEQLHITVEDPLPERSLTSLV